MDVICTHTFTLSCQVRRCRDVDTKYRDSQSRITILEKQIEQLREWENAYHMMETSLKQSEERTQVLTSQLR